MGTAMLIMAESIIERNLIQREVRGMGSASADTAMALRRVLKEIVDVIGRQCARSIEVWR